MVIDIQMPMVETFTYLSSELKKLWREDY